MSEMLRVENVSRRFGGLLAVDQAAFLRSKAASRR
jgi:ABC-type branched-subunit amino acid transport system ATPase component